MRWRNYRESQGSPAGHEVVITCDALDTEHPFIKYRVDMYRRENKHVVLRSVKPKTRGDHDPGTFV